MSELVNILSWSIILLEVIMMGLLLHLECVVVISLGNLAIDVVVDVFAETIVTQFDRLNLAASRSAADLWNRYRERRCPRFGVTHNSITLFSTVFITICCTCISDLFLDQSVFFCDLINDSSCHLR